MGRLVNGINGPIIGKVGTVIGSSWKGIYYIKGPYRTRRGTPGEGETANRNKFAMAQKWLHPVLNFVRVGFKNYSPTVEGFLAAKSWLLRNSFEGVQPDIRINPALVKLSHGTLPLPKNLQVEIQNGLELHVSWTVEITGLDPDKDQVMIAAYDITRGNAYTRPYGMLRETGQDTLLLKGSEAGEYHVYIAFVSANRDSQSDSVYMGTVTVE